MTMSGAARVTLLTILISVLLTAAFHWAYAAVTIGGPLLFEFALIAFLVACAVEFTIRFVRTAREPKKADKP